MLYIKEFIDLGGHLACLCVLTLTPAGPIGPAGPEGPGRPYRTQNDSRQKTFHLNFPAENNL